MSSRKNFLLFAIYMIAFTMMLLITSNSLPFYYVSNHLSATNNNVNANDNDASDTCLLTTRPYSPQPEGYATALPTHLLSFHIAGVSGVPYSSEHNWLKTVGIDSETGGSFTEVTN
jgi:hypothetical protein